MKSAVSSGDIITILAGAAYSAGDIYPFGSRAGVVIADIANGAEGAVALTGVFDLPCGSAETCSIGDDLWFDGTDANTTEAATLEYIGQAVKAKVDGDLTVRVRLAPTASVIGT